MMLVHEDQVKQKVTDIANKVADEFAVYKVNSIQPDTKVFPMDNSFELRRSYSISQRFTAQEIFDKIHLQFLAQKMDNVPFEFGIATTTTGFIKIERRSNGFDTWFADSTGHFRYIRPITPPSGSTVENLLADEVLILIVPDIDKIVNHDLRPRMIIAVLFTLIICTAFFLTVQTMLRQKKLTEIKNDFINNMTHEFKTPLATISLAVDAIRNKKVQEDVKKLSYFSDIIKEENQRMNRQVETILKAALLDKQEIDLNLKPLDAHQIIQDVSDNFALRLQEKGGGLELKLNAANAIIQADEVHFSNLVNNLMDNAVKYGKDNVPPKICLSTFSDEKNFFIKIEDNGIGMTKETLKRIFEKFYRAHTGNIHNVKGFGLGLSYVKSVVDAHNGHIKAESVLGKGSCFTIDLPLQKNK